MGNILGPDKMNDNRGENEIHMNDV